MYARGNDIPVLRFADSLSIASSGVIARALTKISLIFLALSIARSLATFSWSQELGQLRLESIVPQMALNPVSLPSEWGSLPTPANGFPIKCGPGSLTTGGHVTKCGQTPDRRSASGLLRLEMRMMIHR
jgi:hypothetical protein